MIKRKQSSPIACCYLYRTALLLTILLFGLAPIFAEEEKDPEEERLREEVYKYFDTTDEEAFGEEIVPEDEADEDGDGEETGSDVE